MMAYTTVYDTLHPIARRCKLFYQDMQAQVLNIAVDLGCTAVRGGKVKV
jgi:hypothetical protein